jgi:broad specificity phosphatase PhoE
MANNIKSSGTRILLTRHGETEWNRIRRFQGRSDVPLNQRGKDQGHALALALKDEPIKAIYSSPLARAMETARLIRVFHPSAPLVEEEGLVEMDLGEFDGMEASDWASRYPGIRETWRSSPASLKMPGGEGLQEVQVRAMSAMERITRFYPSGSSLLFCSHNFVNRTILCSVMGISLDKFRDLQQDPAALNILCKKEDHWVAEVVNDVSHLKRYEAVSGQA